MAEININAQKREISTKGYLNQLRKNGSIPGVIYAKNKENILISIPELSLNTVVYTTETNIIKVNVDKDESVSCILKDVQFDPLTDKVTHFDFQGITLGEVIEVQVPVNIIGSMEGIRKEGGTLQHVTHKLDVECLPKDIPQHIDLDISSLKIGDSIHVRDLKLENITILNPEDVLIIAVSAAKLQAEDEVAEVMPETEISEPEVIGKGKSEESEEE